MNWALLFSTFVLIFLAELGDKTQLAAMAAAAGEKSPISVFIGASIALVLSTLIAVAIGSAFAEIIPQKYIQIGAGIIFLIFGGVFIFKGLNPAVEITTPAKNKIGVFSSHLLQTAINFEEASFNNYNKLADSVNNKKLGELFRIIASDEKKHLQQIRKIISNKEVFDFKIEKPSETLINTDIFSEKPKDKSAEKILKQIITQERHTAEFYTELSKHFPSTVLKTAFLKLAEKEYEHLTRLQAFL